MYDFILFEISKYPNHYKDVVITAKMLKNQGYSVAIFDYYKEKEECSGDGFPIIELKEKHPIPSLLSKSRNRIINTIGHLIDRVKIAHYQARVLNELEGQYKNMYFGTYCDEVTRSFVKHLDPNANYYTWVVRSALLSTGVKRSLNWGKINYALIRNLVVRSKIKFFVSNEIIKSEFRNLGFSEDRIILRPERFIEDISDNSIDHKGFTLLTIGSLRRSKRIELSLKAVKELKDPELYITIAGKVQGDDTYEWTIEEAGKGLSNFNRVNHRLSEDEYNRYLDSCDFMVLCDEKTDGTITNGTLAEALMHHLPVIVPNYEPYCSYINQYGVGLLYNPDDIDSLVTAIDKAKKIGKESFKPQLANFLSTITLDSVSNTLGNELKRIGVWPK